MLFNKDDQHYMQRAVELAQQAQLKNEVPIGALVVLENKIIGEGYNQPITSHDPTAHAEIVALRDAAKKIGNYRLNNAVLYVTLEPCAMCLSALIHARIKTVIFGALDPKAGAITNETNLLDLKIFNHNLTYRSGLLADECTALLHSFFKACRER